MPASLVDSQLAALEAGEPADWLLVLDDDRGPGAAAAAVAAAWLGPRCCGGRGPGPGL
jgi:hypothetical protein